jgi:hypothetical protein
VSKSEFVIRWVCFYGDSGDYARFVYDRIVDMNRGPVVINALNLAAFSKFHFILVKNK